MKKIITLLFILTNIFNTKSQDISLDTISTPNNKCKAFQYDYNGPKVLINELMPEPAIERRNVIYDARHPDSSIYGAEWLELFNPDWSNAIDISCYILGMYNQEIGDIIYGNFIIPEGTVIPPLGFLVIAGKSADLSAAPMGTQIIYPYDYPEKADGKVWLSRGLYGGWAAMWDNQGIPISMVTWGGDFTKSCSSFPGWCGSAGIIEASGDCSFNGPLQTAKTFKTDGGQAVASYGSFSDPGLSKYRRTDGSSIWSESKTNVTPGSCNTSNFYCSCNGTATVTPISGVEPYTYIWSNNTNSQTTQTATGLCEGTYSVTVTDANQNTGTIVIQIKVNYLQSATPIITYLNDSVLKSNISQYNQWYSQNGLIYGANADTLLISDNELYYTISSENGCSYDTSNIIYITNGINSISKNDNIKVYPNPSNDYIIFNLNKTSLTPKLEIFDIMGVCVFEENISDYFKLDVSKYNKGLFFYNIITNETILSGKFIVN